MRMQRTLWQKAAGVIGMGHGSLPIAHVGCHYRVEIMHRKLSSSENLHFLVHHLGRLEKEQRRYKSSISIVLSPQNDPRSHW